MIIFIYGEDQYRAKQKFIELLDGFGKKYDPSGLNTERFGTGAEMGAVQSAIMTPPFLAQKRLVALEGIWGKKITKDEATPWIELLKSVPESTVLVCRETIEADAATKHSIIGKFPKNLSSRAASRELVHYAFPPMTLAEAASWIEREVQSQGGRGDRAAIQELLARVGTDSGLLSQEIGKLVAYAQGRPITKDDIETLVLAGIESDIFAAMDALSSRDRGRAIDLLHGRLRAGDNELYLFTMLAREIRILLMVKDAISLPPSHSTIARTPSLPRGTKQSHLPHGDRSALAQTLKLHPFVVGKAMAHAARFTLAELKGLHHKLFFLDWGVKQGKVTPVLALDMFIASVG